MQERTGRNGLGVGDGFKFGCGFIISWIVFNVVIFAILAVIGIVISIFGYTFTIPGLE